MVKQDILFIVNPNSGRDRNKSSLTDAIRSHLDSNKFNAYVEFTKRANHANELTHQYLRKGFTNFVAVGGDGTINEIGSALLYKNAVLSIISKGSGNGLARHLGIFEDEKISINRINTGKIIEIDAGTINDIPFLCTAGIGFDAFCAKEFNSKKGRGLKNYINVGMRSFWAYKPVDLYFDGRAASVFSLSIGNASQFGNNAYITPRAEVDNGFLDCCIVNSHPKLQSIKLLTQLFRKKIDQSQYVDYYRNTAFEIETKKPPLIHFDGEYRQLETSNIKVQVLAKALKIKL